MDGGGGVLHGGGAMGALHMLVELPLVVALETACVDGTQLARVVFHQDLVHRPLCRYLHTQVLNKESAENKGKRSGVSCFRYPALLSSTDRSVSICCRLRSRINNANTNNRRDIPLPSNTGLAALYKHLRM